MVIVAQLVRASDCGSEGRGFESHHSPGLKQKSMKFMISCFFVLMFTFLFFKVRRHSNMTHKYTRGFHNTYCC